MLTVPHIYVYSGDVYEPGWVCAVCRARGDPAAMVLVRADQVDRAGPALASMLNQLKSPTGRVAKAVVVVADARPEGAVSLADGAGEPEMAALAREVLPADSRDMLAAGLREAEHGPSLPFAMGAKNTVIFYKDRQVYEILQDVPIPDEAVAANAAPGDVAVAFSTAGDTGTLGAMQSIVDRMTQPDAASSGGN